MQPLHRGRGSPLADPIESQIAADADTRQWHRSGGKEEDRAALMRHAPADGAMRTLGPNRIANSDRCGCTAADSGSVGDTSHKPKTVTPSAGRRVPPASVSDRGRWEYPENCPTMLPDSCKADLNVLSCSWGQWEEML